LSFLSLPTAITRDKRASGDKISINVPSVPGFPYFNSFAPGETVTLRIRLRTKYPMRARTFQSRVYEYYDQEVSSLVRPVQLEMKARQCPIFVFLGYCFEGGTPPLKSPDWPPIFKLRANISCDATLHGTVS
jgi:hypothetical protein